MALMSLDDFNPLGRRIVLDPAERQERARLAASADGMDGPAAYEVLVRQGMWPGSLDPMTVAEVVVEPGENPLVPLRLTFKPAGEA